MARPDRTVSYFAHYVRSYRHPNLEELLFSGPATTGNIVPNLQVKPETGHNVDIGTRFRLAACPGDAVVLQQHLSRLHLDGDCRAGAGRLHLAGHQSGARAHSGARGGSHGPVRHRQPVVAAAGQPRVQPRHGARGREPDRWCRRSTAQPQDNITPWKFTGGLRVGDLRERWWASYSLRQQAEVTRVSPLLADSEFLIAQDLFGPAGVRDSPRGASGTTGDAAPARRADAGGRQPDRRVLPRTLPIRAGPGPVGDPPAAHPRRTVAASLGTRGPSTARAHPWAAGPAWRGALGGTRSAPCCHEGLAVLIH